MDASATEPPVTAEPAKDQASSEEVSPTPAETSADAPAAEVPAEEPQAPASLDEELESLITEAAPETTVTGNIDEFFESATCEDIIDEQVLSKIPGLPAKENREMVLRVKVGQGGIINGNNRYYPPKLMQREFARLKEKVDRRGAFSNDQHPRREKGGDGKVKMVDLPTFSSTTFIPHSVVMNEALEIFSVGVIPKTPAGSALAAVIRAGGRPGISTRGSGTLAKKKINYQGKDRTVDVVQDNYKLLTFDTVIDQSVTDAGIRDISESHQEQIAETPVNQKMKLTDWKTKYPEAFTALQESLKDSGTVLDDIKSLDETLHTNLRRVAAGSMEKEVEEKLFSKFDEYCESVKGEITAEEIQEAVALEFAAFLVEHGVDEALATKISAKPDLLGQAVSEACKQLDGMDLDTPAATKSGADESLAAHPKFQELSESVDDLRKELATSKKNEAIAKAQAAFPYKQDLFSKRIQPMLDECETAEDVQGIFESQMELLKDAGVATVPKGSARFLNHGSDTAAVDEAEEAARAKAEAAAADPFSAMIDEAGQDLATLVPAK